MDWGAAGDGPVSWFSSSLWGSIVPGPRPQPVQPQAAEGESLWMGRQFSFTLSPFFSTFQITRMTSKHKINNSFYCLCLSFAYLQMFWLVQSYRKKLRSKRIQTDKRWCVGIWIKPLSALSASNTGTSSTFLLKMPGKEAEDSPSTVIYIYISLSC